MEIKIDIYMVMVKQTKTRNTITVYRYSSKINFQE